MNANGAADSQELDHSVLGSVPLGMRMLLDSDPGRGELSVVAKQVTVLSLTQSNKSHDVQGQGCMFVPIFPSVWPFE